MVLTEAFIYMKTGQGFWKKVVWKVGFIYMEIRRVMLGGGGGGGGGERLTRRD